TRWPRDWSSDVCSSDLVITERVADECFVVPRDCHPPKFGCERRNEPAAIVVAGNLRAAGLRRSIDQLGHNSILLQHAVVVDWSRSEERRVGEEGRCRGS